MKLVRLEGLEAQGVAVLVMAVVLLESSQGQAELPRQGREDQASGRELFVLPAHHGV